MSLESEKKTVNSIHVPPSIGLGIVPQLPQQCSCRDDPHSTKEETINNKEA